MFYIRVVFSNALLEWQHRSFDPHASPVVYFFVWLLLVGFLIVSRRFKRKNIHTWSMRIKLRCKFHSCRLFELELSGDSRNIRIGQTLHIIVISPSLTETIWISLRIHLLRFNAFLLNFGLRRQVMCCNESSIQLFAAFNVWTRELTLIRGLNGWQPEYFLLLFLVHGVAPLLFVQVI